jgi:hypothetical protein
MRKKIKSDLRKKFIISLLLKSLYLHQFWKVEATGKTALFCYESKHLLVGMTGYKKFIRRSSQSFRRGTCAGKFG